jgi:hypothetical protein
MSADVSIPGEREHTSAYVRIRPHMSAYVSVYGRIPGECEDIQERSDEDAHAAVAYVSIRQHTSAYVSIRQHMSAYVSIRQHTSAYVSIRQERSDEDAHATVSN